MSIDGQGHFFTIYFPGFVCFVLYLAKIAGERLQDHWSSGSFSPSNISVSYFSAPIRAIVFKFCIHLDLRMTKYIVYMKFKMLISFLLFQIFFFVPHL